MRELTKEEKEEILEGVRVKGLQSYFCNYTNADVARSMRMEAYGQTPTINFYRDTEFGEIVNLYRAYVNQLNDMCETHSETEPKTDTYDHIKKFGLTNYFINIKKREKFEGTVFNIVVEEFRETHDKIVEKLDQWKKELSQ